MIPAEALQRKHIKISERDVKRTLSSGHTTSTVSQPVMAPMQAAPTKAIVPSVRLLSWHPA
jgi:hypothetical protein